MKELGIWMLISFAVILIWIGMCELGRRTPAFTDENCIRALIGEYAKEDPRGMALMAHAIRNRKTLKGVFGFHASHVDHESRMVWELAELAWFSSKTERDPLHGATEWRSRKDVQQGHTPKGYFLIHVYDGTYFYKQPGR